MFAGGVRVVWRMFRFYGRWVLGGVAPGTQAHGFQLKAVVLCSLNAYEDAQHATSAIALGLQAAEWNSKY